MDVPAPPNDDHELQLLPLDPELEVAGRRQALSRLPVGECDSTDEHTEPRPRPQFTLSEVLVLTGICCVTLALGRIFPPQIVAGITGFLTLATLTVMLLLGATGGKITAAWTIILLTYCLTCVAAMFG